MDLKHPICGCVLAVFNQPNSLSIGSFLSAWQFITKLFSNCFSVWKTQSIRLVYSSQLYLFAFASAQHFLQPSFFIFSISSSVKPERSFVRIDLLFICCFIFCPETFKLRLNRMSNVTSTCVYTLSLCCWNYHLSGNDQLVLFPASHRTLTLAITWNFHEGWLSEAVGEWSQTFSRNSCVLT